MPRRPIGDVAMTDAERSRRRRAKAKAQAAANGKEAGAPVEVARTQPPAVDLLGGPEDIAARIFERVSVDMARGIAMALQQRLWQTGGWPTWAPPILS